MSERSIRVRYGKVESNGRWVRRGADDATGNLGRWETDKVPKNTLVTIREGDLIYFGIARCHNQLDVFRKTLGTKIATRRCNLAVAEFNDITTENFTMHSSGLRGVVKADSIPVLLQYFADIDRAGLLTYTATRAERKLDVEVA